MRLEEYKETEYAVRRI